MVKQTIHIIDFKILYNILDEIKDYLKFQILHYKNEENFLNSNNMNLNDSLILVRSNKQVFLNNGKISRKKIFSIPNYPIKIDKLVEILNVNLIKQKYNYQSSIHIKDYKYNYLLVIEYNTKKIKPNKGSAIFIHLTKNFKPTAGCVALLQKDFLILVKLINKKSTIKIS